MNARLIRPTLLLAALVASVTAAADLTRIVKFDIPAQSVQSALFKFSEQSNVQVVVAAQVVTDKKTEAVTGELQVGQGLAQLLSGTGLEYAVVNEHTVAIRAVGVGAAEQRVESGILMAQADSANNPLSETETDINSSVVGHAPKENLHEVSIDIPEILSNIS